MAGIAVVGWKSSKSLSSKQVESTGLLWYVEPTEAVSEAVGKHSYIFTSSTKLRQYFVWPFFAGKAWQALQLLTTTHCVTSTSTVTLQNLLKVRYCCITVWCGKSAIHCVLYGTCFAHTDSTEREGLWRLLSKAAGYLVGHTGFIFKSNHHTILLK